MNSILPLLSSLPAATFEPGDRIITEEEPVELAEVVVEIAGGEEFHGRAGAALGDSAGWRLNEKQNLRRV